MAITQEEAQHIAQIATPIFDGVLGEYEFRKYPAANYVGFQQRFSNLDPMHQDIHDAMVWKYGHWGKANFPQTHKDLIQNIQQLWVRFTESLNSVTPSCTFQWWRNQLPENARYITVAYLTHLIHHASPLPIIDQHNFRAMNYLVSQVRDNYRFNRKPSKWADIIHLKEFMETLLPHLGNVEFAELDRFLMMYGKNHAPR